MDTAPSLEPADPVPSSSPGGVTPYDAPAYFPGSYFYRGGGTTPAQVAAEPTGPDGAAYSTLVALIEATGAFQAVVFGAAVERSEAGADSYPLAIVTPKAWEEVDEFDPALIRRRVSFAITVVVKSRDATSPFDRLDDLTSVVKGVVDRSDLGGTSLGPLTRIGAGRYDASTRHPERSVELDGEFTSLIDPLGG